MASPGPLCHPLKAVPPIMRHLVAGLALLGMSIMAVGAVVAQQPRRPYRIGVLNEAWAANHPTVEGLKAGLRELGFEEGRDVTFDIRFTEGNPQATSAAAAALVKAGLDLIFTSNEAATQAAKAATQRLPIVFTLVGDPVAAGIVTKLAQPGGNLTGISSLTTELVPKRLEALKTLMPTVRRVWAIYYADDPSSIAAVQKAQETAPRLKLGRGRCAPPRSSSGRSRISNRGMRCSPRTSPRWISLP
jgi:ABC-type uncharacterized transport system substrate-binding protein